MVLADVAAAPVLTFIRSAAVRKKLAAGQTTNELSGISKLVEKDNKVSKEEEGIEEAESDFEDDDDDGSDEQRRLRNRSGPFRRLTAIRSELYH